MKNTQPGYDAERRNQPLRSRAEHGNKAGGVKDAMKNTSRINNVLRRSIVFAFIMLLVLTILVRSNPATRILGRDEGFYVYIGSEILHGRVPYIDAWEAKPPAIFYLNALGIRLTRGSRWGVWFIELASLVAASLLSYEFIKRQWGTWPALFGTTLWLYGLDRTFYGGGNLTEEYCLPLHFLAIILMMKLLKAPVQRLYNFVLGAIFALSFLFRPNNAALETAVVLTLLIAWILNRQYRHMFVSLVWMGLGAAIPLLVPLLYFWSKGALQGLLDGTIFYPLIYVQAPGSSTPVLLAGFQILGIGVGFAALGYIALLYQMRKFQKERLLNLPLFLLMGWPLVILLSDPAHKDYAHYYINWLPFIALLSALAIFSFQSRFLPRTVNSPAADFVGILLFLALTAAVFVVSSRAVEYGRVLARLEDRDRRSIEFRSATAIYAENHTRPNDYVLFWSASPGENYMANRESPTASLYYPLYLRSSIGAKLSDQFLRDLIEKKPALIVDIGRLNTLSLDPAERQRRIASGIGSEYLPDNIDEVFAYIDQNYHKVAVVAKKTVYRLNGTQ